jgi:hypothetical protein
VKALEEISYEAAKPMAEEIEAKISALARSAGCFSFSRRKART